MNKEEFYEALKNIGITLSQQQESLFEEYYKLLVEYNEHTNITAITNLEDVYLKHFYDSSLLCKCLDFKNITNMLDIGCGAGFPGLVIKILFPNIRLTLLDSNNKKTNFCKLLIEKLSLNNVEIITSRAETFISNRREYYDLVTARAVKNLPVLNELAIPYVKENGKFIAMKSNFEDELKNGLRGITILGAKYIETINIDLPKNMGKRNFLIIEKITKTNIKYPRSYNQIIKKPL